MEWEGVFLRRRAGGREDHKLSQLVPPLLFVLLLELCSTLTHLGTQPETHTHEAYLMLLLGVTGEECSYGLMPYRHLLQLL